ncbi:hypothetical protein ACN47E_002650 [Coniothyrium glycines]
MSLIASSAARLKPEVRLAQAISLFEASLSDEQKKGFRHTKQQSIHTPPNPDDVMLLTAQISQSHKLGSRCYGPRFTKFLHGAQQFAAMGDVVIGGSQNIIACGVWSLVRMTILGLVNLSSYIESFSKIFMEAGRALPQHSNLALLYPRSQELQSFILEYFIVVVQLCQRFLHHTQKSAVRKFVSSLNDADLQEDHSKLLSWSKSIHEQMTLLMASTTEEEATNNSRFRAMMIKSSKASTQQQRMQASQKILDFCTTYDYETSWRQIRKAGSTAIHIRCPEYEEWKDESKSSVLLFEGRLGCGKSVMVANMVDDLAEASKRMHFSGKPDPHSANSARAVVAYFFCRHNEPESLKARTILGALMRQLIHPFINQSRITEVPTASTNMRQLISLLQFVQPGSRRIYVLVDGLDLCEPAEAKEVADKLNVMRSFLLIHLCVTCRPEIPGKVGALPELFPFPETKTVVLPNNSVEIEAFIDADLERCIEERSLVLGDPTIVLDIRRALSEGSQGMFLWVSLQIKALCMMQTDAEIREALATLPRDLSGIYLRILRQSESSAYNYQLKVLKLVLAAKRPLTVEEMREALSVEHGNTIWDSSKLPNNIYAVLSTCGCLIEVEEEGLTISTIHPSVDQFLLDDRAQPESIWSEESITWNTVRQYMLSTITTYLNYGVFGTELATRRPTVDISSAPATIIGSTIASSLSVQNIALKLLRARKQSKIDISRLLKDELHSQKSEEAMTFHFHQYAKQFVIEHAIEVVEVCDRHTFNSLTTLLDRNIISINNMANCSVLMRAAIKLEVLSAIDYLIHWMLDSGREEYDAQENLTCAKEHMRYAIDNDEKSTVRRYITTFEHRSMFPLVGGLEYTGYQVGNSLDYAIEAKSNQALEVILDINAKAVQLRHLRATIENHNHAALKLLLSKLLVYKGHEELAAWKEQLGDMFDLATRLENSQALWLLGCYFARYRRPESMPTDSVVGEGGHRTE